LVNLIEKLSDESACFKTYAELQNELLHRVDRDGVFADDSARKEFEAKEESVFSRVDQHKADGESGLNLFAEQFMKVHDGVDHKRFTEQWLHEHTGEEVQLERVLENPTFNDFIGVYDVMPLTAYIASKMIIDEADFMGVFDLGGGPARKVPGSYRGVAEDCGAAMPDEELKGLQMCESSRDKGKAAGEAEARAAVAEGKFGAASCGQMEQLAQAKAGAEDTTAGAGNCCGSSDASVQPHILGSGQYLQFRLRDGNVRQYLNNSLISKRLEQLTPDDPMEPVYIFTASANGVMRFHPCGGIRRKLWYGYGDSERVEAFPKNMVHAVKYGCFCFGVIYREKENYTDSTGTVRKGGRTIVMRYNRWATDNAPIYALVRQRDDERDASVPRQESMLSHYRRVVLARILRCGDAQ